MTHPSVLPSSPEYQFVYDRLRMSAQRGTHVFYTELADGLDELAIDPASAPAVGEVLDAIAEHEHAAGRPILCALVITGKAIPGEAFFAAARRLGVLTSAEPAEEMRFWAAEVERVWATWKR